MVTRELRTYIIVYQTMVMFTDFLIILSNLLSILTWWRGICDATYNIEHIIITIITYFQHLFISQNIFISEKKVVFYTISVNHRFYLSKFHKNISVTLSGDCECPFTIQAILTGPSSLNRLVQIKPVCEKLSLWIANSAMGSESINPKIQWSERSLYERLF